MLYMILMGGGGDYSSSSMFVNFVEVWLLLKERERDRATEKS